MVVFTPDECEYIKSFYYNEEAIDSTKIKGYSIDSIKFSKGVASYVDSTDVELLNFLCEKLNHIGVVSVPGAKIIRYQKSNFLARHSDFIKYGTRILHKTLIFQLSHSHEYVGGDFLIDDVVQSRQIGSVFSINPTTPHEVTEVISGERFSLGLFLTEENLQYNKTLI